MPILKRQALALTGRGSYTLPLSERFIAQTSSASADYFTNVFYVPPYIAGPGLSPQSVESQPYGDTTIYSVQAVYIVTDTAVTGTGSSGAGATAKLLKYNAGSATGTIASLAFDTNVNTTALEGKSLGTISATYGYLSAGDSLVFEWLQGGTGLALPAGFVIVDLV